MCNSSCNFEFFYFTPFTRLLKLYMIVFLWLWLQPKAVFIVNLVNNILDNSLGMHWLNRNQLPLDTNRHIAVWSWGTFIQQLRKCKAPVTHNISDSSYWCRMGTHKISVPLTIKNRRWKTTFKQSIYTKQKHAVAFSHTYMKSGKRFKKLEYSNTWKLCTWLQVLLLIYLWKIKEVF